ncbi:unnamed protein product [Urochloa decumbens]|uniref:F-box domain-containing protein n=1 Tax=Urochloa decumbens TaxID=240449 RepID=A0ABC9E976_9POAL
MECPLVLARLLPDDVLADVLCHVTPRGLAVSRCVCGAWRTLIDDRCLLRVDLLPRSRAGLVISYGGLLYPELFVRPSEDPYDYDMPNSVVLDHVLQRPPPTLRLCAQPRYGSVRATLPDRPSPGVGMEYFIDNTYLAFDPTVSSHYEVFLIPSIPRKCPLDREVERVGSDMLRSEWPPSPWILSVFSSRTGLWEERSFIREGEAAGTVADMQLDWRYLPSRHAEYWRGALYIIVGTYRVIKPSRGIEMFQGQEFHLGRSDKGICFALLDDKLRMWVWILEESCEQIEWKLRHCSEQELAFPRLSSDHGPWILSNINGDDETEDDDDDDQEGSRKTRTRLEIRRRQ